MYIAFAINNVKLIKPFNTRTSFSHGEDVPCILEPHDELHDADDIFREETYFSDSTVTGTETCPYSDTLTSSPCSTTETILDREMRF